MSRSEGPRKASDRRSAAEAECALCHGAGRPVAGVIGVCAECLVHRASETIPLCEAAHRASRSAFGLPGNPPRATDGVRCVLCSNECVIPEGDRGFCGLRANREGRLRHLAGTPSQGLLHWYRDALPTNCVADWVCEGHAQWGCHNLAVFYASCTADCLFCQNWHFREISPADVRMTTAEELASAANSRTFCACFFGGDPSSQMPHALAASRILAQRGVRICWETNGMMHPRFLDAALEVTAATQGYIKFDLKAFDDSLHRALCGVSNRRALENFERAARRIEEKARNPLVVASTLLVPGYVEAEQVAKIAGFIATLNPDIPYALLAFAPHFRMSDLPFTSVEQALTAEAAAREAGLHHVRIGNQHLLTSGRLR